MNRERTISKRDFNFSAVSTIIADKVSRIFRRVLTPLSKKKLARAMKLNDDGIIIKLQGKITLSEVYESTSWLEGVAELRALSWNAKRITRGWNTYAYVYARVRKRESQSTRIHSSRWRGLSINGFPLGRARYVLPGWLDNRGGNGRTSALVDFIEMLVNIMRFGDDMFAYIRLPAAAMG